MMNTVVCALTNLFQIMLLYQCIQLFFEETYVKLWKQWLIFGAFYVSNTCLYLLYSRPWLNLIINLAGLAGYTLLYTKSVKKILFVTGIMYALALCSDAIAILPFVEYQAGEVINQVYTILTTFWIFICRLLLEKLLNFHKKNTQVQSLSLILVPFCSILLIVLAALGNMKKESIVVALAVGLLVINFLILYLYNMLLKAFSRKYENEILEQRMQEYRNQLSIIAESDERVASLRHDLKHHLCELSVMAEKNQASDVKEYLHDMIDFLQNPKEIMATGNREVDSLLNFWLGKAKRSLRQVKAEVKIPEKLSDTFDVNTVLGNLLENAIEAAVQTEEQSLEISVRYDRGFLQINMKNSCPNHLQKLDNGYATTKKDKRNHGLGLKNVKRIVDKYHGELELREQEGIFFTNVVLYL